MGDKVFMFGMAAVSYITAVLFFGREESYVWLAIAAIWNVGLILRCAIKD